MKNKHAYLCAAFLLLSSFFSIPIAIAQDTQVLGNSEIIEIVTKGLPGSVIMKKIENSPNNFDLSTDALIKLSEAKVSEDIITAMMAAEQNKIGDNYELVKKFDEPGIYFSIDNDDVKYLAPTVIDKVKEGSFGSHMAGALTSAAKQNVKAIITGTTANMETNNSPVFYFYFGKADDGSAKNQKQYDPNDPVAMMQALKNMSVGERIHFSGIQSPNEIRLVRPDVDKKERSFIASSSSGMVKETGISSDFVVQFKNDRLSPGLYKVYCEKPLPPGQYLFVYAGSALYAGQYVYDFTVK